MIFKPTTASAIEFAKADKLEEWIHLFLRGEGNNVAFSDGLKLEPRNFYPPEEMPLNAFKRCCGPEENMIYRIPEAGFIERVGKITERYSKGDWDMPPLIVCREETGYVLNDGSHRYEALKKLGKDKYWVIIWETVK